MVKENSSFSEFNFNEIKKEAKEVKEEVAERENETPSSKEKAREEVAGVAEKGGETSSPSLPSPPSPELPLVEERAEEILLNNHLPILILEEEEKQKKEGKVVNKKNLSYWIKRLSEEKLSPYFSRYFDRGRKVCLVEPFSVEVVKQQFNRGCIKKAHKKRNREIQV